MVALEVTEERARGVAEDLDHSHEFGLSPIPVPETQIPRYSAQLAQLPSPCHAMPCPFSLRRYLQLSIDALVHTCTTPMYYY